MKVDYLGTYWSNLYQEQLKEYNQQINSYKRSDTVIESSNDSATTAIEKNAESRLNNNKSESINDALGKTERSKVENTLKTRVNEEKLNETQINEKQKTVNFKAAESTYYQNIVGNTISLSGVTNDLIKMMINNKG